jgi:hypothetical protein
MAHKYLVATILGTLGTLVPACTLHITGDQSITITPDTLANTIWGTSYRVELNTDVKGGDFRWQVGEGVLPPGLSLAEDSGVISGRPTAAGTFGFTVRATETSLFARSASKTYALVVIEKLAVTFKLEHARVNEPYASTPAMITGGVRPYTLGIVGLPAGLDFDPNSYCVVGTPQAQHSGLRVELTVADSGSPQQTVTATATLVISPVGVAITTAPPLADAPIGQKYSVRVEADGGLEPYTWAVTTGVLPGSSLDSGQLRLNRSTGVISGTPGQRATTQTFAVTVTDDDSPASTDAREYKIVVPVSVVTTTLDPAAAGTAYDEALTAAGGLPPYAWAVSSGQLPAGLQLDATTGVISGTPATGATTQTFKLRVSDSDSPASQSEREFTLTVTP